MHNQSPYANCKASPSCNKLLDKYKYVIDHGTMHSTSTIDEDRFKGDLLMDEKTVRNTAKSIAGEANVKIEINAAWLECKSISKNMLQIKGSFEKMISSAEDMLTTWREEGETEENLVRVTELISGSQNDLKLMREAIAKHKACKANDSDLAAKIQTVKNLIELAMIHCEAWKKLNEGRIDELSLCALRSMPAIACQGSPIVILSLHQVLELFASCCIGLLWYGEGCDGPHGRWLV